jgi:hypothetical protein
VHEALICARREGMRPKRRNRRFGRHTGVADRVRTRHVREIEALGDLGRIPNLLVDLDGLASP